MARKVKNIIENGIDKREVGYYSTPSFIADYLTSEMLSINPDGTKVLDPAVGKEELLKKFYDAGKEIDSYDIIDFGIHRYSTFHQQNFIEYYANFIGERLFNSATDYDYMIANPPYNCHEIEYIKENKKYLNKLFAVGAYNMYSMFLSAMIDIAKEGCLIGVIISDSFLTSAYHSKLREQIFENCSIHQIILCPTNLFWSQKADVRTCLLILQKGKKYQSDVLISNRANNIEDLQDILTNRKFKRTKLDNIRLNCGKSANQILIDVDPNIVKLFSTHKLLNEVFKCVTCISTGNDNKYLSSEKKEGYTIPFYKNPASRRFVTDADAFLIDDYLIMHQSDKNFMVRNKPLLNNEGIACSSMGLPFCAAYLPKEAVTGVNPTIFPPAEDINWLLSYLNSSFVTYIIRGILIRSNMVTSGYVGCIPILNFSDDDKNKLSEISSYARKGIIRIDDAVSSIDEIVFDNVNLSVNTKNQIIYFSKNLGKCV